MTTSELKINGIRSITELSASVEVFRPARAVQLNSHLEDMSNFDHAILGPNRFDFEEVAVGEVVDAYLFRSGALVTSDGYVIRETLEGSLADNGIKPDESGRIDIRGLTISSFEQPVICASKFGTFNYSVFLHEVLPSIYLSSFSKNLQDLLIPIYFPNFFPHDRRSKILDLISLFVDRDRVVHLDQEVYRVSKAYVFKAGPARQMARVKRVMPSMMSELNFTLGGIGSERLDRIYVCREAGTIRSLSNREEMLDLVASYGFAPVELAGLGLDEQARLFNGAKFILAEHGAALANLWYCSRGTKVFEIFPRPLLGRWIYRQVSRIMGLEYRAVAFDTPENWIWNKDQVEIPVQMVDAELRKWS